MHPAPSIILFTTASGAGFGLLFWLGLGLPAPTGWAAFWHYALAYLLAGGGLAVSAFHLGHPERAPKAFTQWRSSWLSREACAAVACLAAIGLGALAQIFGGTRLPVLGVVGAVLALLTVYTTSMIYAQLRTVPRWNHWVTPAHFMAYALGGGALLAGQIWAAPWLVALAAGLQLYAWRRGDTALAASGTDLATATQLTGGAVRAFEPPHTGTNYLLREMVHVVGRKHSRKLRLIALALAFALPALVVLILPMGAAALVLAALLHLAGVLTARWLFFAEAEHVVGLYYGRR